MAVKTKPIVTSTDASFTSTAKGFLNDKDKLLTAYSIDRTKKETHKCLNDADYYYYNNKVEGITNATPVNGTTAAVEGKDINWSYLAQLLLRIITPSTTYANPSYVFNATTCRDHIKKTLLKTTATSSHFTYFSSSKLENVNGILNHFSSKNKDIYPIIIEVEIKIKGGDTITTPVMITGIAYGHEMTDISSIADFRLPQNYRSNTTKTVYNDFLKTIITNTKQTWAIIHTPLGNPLTYCSPAGDTIKSSNGGISFPDKGDPLYGKEIYVPFSWIQKVYKKQVLTVYKDGAEKLIESSPSTVAKSPASIDYGENGPDKFLALLKKYVLKKPYDHVVPNDPFSTRPYDKHKPNSITSKSKFDCSGGPGWVLYHLMGYSKAYNKWHTDSMLEGDKKLELTAITKDQLKPGDLIFYLRVRTSDNNNKYHKWYNSDSNGTIYPNVSKDKDNNYVITNTNKYTLDNTKQFGRRRITDDNGHWILYGDASLSKYKTDPIIPLYGIDPTKKLGPGDESKPIYLMQWVTKWIHVVTYFGDIKVDGKLMKDAVLTAWNSGNQFVTLTYCNSKYIGKDHDTFNYAIPEYYRIDWTKMDETFK